MQDIKTQSVKQPAKGFTLIELLIVIAIIGLLATLAIVSLTGAQRKARDTKRLADAKQYQGAIELYYNEQGNYPTPTDWSDFTSDIITDGGIGKYITQAPGSPTNDDTDDFYSYGYTYLTASGITSTDQYVFIVNHLEDVTANSASLLASDHTDYTNAGTATGPTGWVAANTVTFIPSVTTATVVKTCDTATTSGIYCVAE